MDVFIEECGDNNMRAALTWLRWQLDVWRLELGLVEVVPFGSIQGRIVVANGNIFMVKDKEN